MRVLVFGQIFLRHGANAEPGDAPPFRRRVGDLQDHHVAAVSLATVDVATGRGARLERCDDLEEVVPGRADDIHQAPFGDAGIAVGHLDSQDVAQLLARAFEILADEDALPQLHRVTPFSVRLPLS